MSVGSIGEAQNEHITPSIKQNKEINKQRIKLLKFKLSRINPNRLTIDLYFERISRERDSNRTFPRSNCNQSKSPNVLFILLFCPFHSIPLHSFMPILFKWKPNISKITGIRQNRSGRRLFVIITCSIVSCQITQKLP